MCNVIDSIVLRLIVWFFVIVFMLLSPAAEKVTKERRSSGRGASKFGERDRQLKFGVYAEFFAILSPLRNPLSCAPAERAW